MKKQQVLAAFIFAIVALWMVIPRGSRSTAEVPETPARQIAVIPESAQASENPEIITVRAIRVSPQTYVEQVRVRGRTQAFRHVQVRAEQAGRIVSEPVARGARVSAGDILCEISVDNRGADLQEAQARRKQAQFEYDASVDLQARNLQSDVAVAQLEAALESAKAAVARAELALTNTRIVAPFDGIVETRTVELGDLLNVGAVCASVLDDSPMLLVGLVPEQDVKGIQLGATVNGQLLSGEQVRGTVSYLASAADPVSRSYRIEVALEPSTNKIREGITTEIMVETADVTAHLIPSSALTLDDAGVIGVKLIDGNDRVVFRNITIVGDATSQVNPGIWVTGLSGNVNLVTLGQEIVFPGQSVESNFDWSN